MGPVAHRQRAALGVCRHALVGSADAKLIAKVDRVWSPQGRPPENHRPPRLDRAPLPPPANAIVLLTAGPHCFLCRFSRPPA